MCDARWQPALDNSLTFGLFSQHYTELNNMYWANKPAENKIKKLAKEAHSQGKERPIDFFIVHDEDDRRVAPDFGSWKKSYSDFNN